MLVGILLVKIRNSTHLQKSENHLSAPNEAPLSLRGLQN